MRAIAIGTLLGVGNAVSVVKTLKPQVENEGTSTVQSPKGDSYLSSILGLPKPGFNVETLQSHENATEHAEIISQEECMSLTPFKVQSDKRTSVNVSACTTMPDGYAHTLSQLVVKGTMRDYKSGYDYCRDEICDIQKETIGWAIDQQKEAASWKDAPDAEDIPVFLEVTQTREISFPNYDPVDPEVILNRPLAIRNLEDEAGQEIANILGFIGAGLAGLGAIYCCCCKRGTARVSPVSV
ncbi:MAG: hypothetical protein ACI9BD_001254 [Candidatus Marinamargulisbacteria bacterium]|jgi:hypothetical protein